MRVAALAMLGLFGLAGCRPAYGLRAAGALPTRAAPGCVVEAVRTAPGVASFDTRTRRRDGREIVEIRYSDAGTVYHGRLFLVTGTTAQHAVFSATWLAGLGPPGWLERAEQDFRQIETRISAQCGTALVTTAKPCTGSACWALD